MSIAKKSIITLAAALITTGFLATNAAWAADKTKDEETISNADTVLQAMSFDLDEAWDYILSCFE